PLAFDLATPDKRTALVALDLRLGLVCQQIDQHAPEIVPRPFIGGTQSTHTDDQPATVRERIHQPVKRRRPAGRAAVVPPACPPRSRFQILSAAEGETPSGQPAGCRRYIRIYSASPSPASGVSPSTSGSAVSSCG